MNEQTEILVSWLRCFDSDERDARVAARCADEIERLSAEGRRMREALTIIADHYMPDWKPGDTHETGQRFAKIAYKTIAAVSGSQYQVFKETPELTEAIGIPLKTACEYCSGVMDARICEEPFDCENGTQLVCTRQPQHEGKHVACGAHHVIGMWGNARDDSKQCQGPHDFVSRGDGTAKCADCGELCDVSETCGARTRTSVEKGQ